MSENRKEYMMNRYITENKKGLFKNYWIKDKKPSNNEQVLIKVKLASGAEEVVQGFFTDEDKETFGNGGVWFETPKFAKDDAIFPIDCNKTNVVIGWLPLDIL